MKTMYYYHHLLFSLLLLILALPSFAIFPNKERFLDPNTVAGSVKLKLTRIRLKSPVETAKINVKFNSLTPLPDRQATGSNIAVIGFDPPVTGKNDKGISQVLDITEIACECFKDIAGNETFGIPFTVAAKPEDAGYRLPSEPQSEKSEKSEQAINSIFCSDLRGLQTYFDQKDITPAELKEELGPAEGILVDNFERPSPLAGPTPSPPPPPPFADLNFQLRPARAQRVFVPFTDDRVTVDLSATSVKMINVVGKDGKNIDGKGVLCRIYFEGEGLNVTVGVNTEFGGTKKIESAKCVETVVS
ncbi:MAG: hypothetical protein Q9210_004268 [Variospora velana]